LDRNAGRERRKTKGANVQRFICVYDVSGHHSEFKAALMERTWNQRVKQGSVIYPLALTTLTQSFANLAAAVDSFDAAASELSEKHAGFAVERVAIVPVTEKGWYVHVLNEQIDDKLP
jgi:hypothetical protein